MGKVLFFILFGLSSISYAYTDPAGEPGMCCPAGQAAPPRVDDLSEVANCGASFADNTGSVGEVIKCIQSLSCYFGRPPSYTEVIKALKPAKPGVNFRGVTESDLSGQPATPPNDLRFVAGFNGGVWCTFLLNGGSIECADIPLNGFGVNPVSIDLGGACSHDFKSVSLERALDRAEGRCDTCHKAQHFDIAEIVEGKINVGGQPVDALLSRYDYLKYQNEFNRGENELDNELRASIQSFTFLLNGQPPFGQRRRRPPVTEYSEAGDGLCERLQAVIDNEMPMPSAMETANATELRRQAGCEEPEIDEPVPSPEIRVPQVSPSPEPSPELRNPEPEVRTPEPTPEPASLEGMGSE